MRGYIIGPEILGHPVFMDRYKKEGKPAIVILLQNISAFVDSLVLCRFLQFAMSVSTFCEMLNLITGEEITEEELLEIGERIYNLERKFNIEAGFSDKDDLLPERFLKETLSEGSSRNRVVELKPMLEEYYKLRGWDPQGNPTQTTLSRLAI